MILQPFTVTSRGKTYTAHDRLGINSQTTCDCIQQLTLAVLATMQDDAKCAALGVDEVGGIANINLGIFDGPELAGVFFAAAIEYQSGPWIDTVDWVVVSDAPAIFHARVMPGFPGLTLDESLDLSVDVAHTMMATMLQTVGGEVLFFERFSWAIYKDRTDAESRAMKRIHDHAAADTRFRVTEVLDPVDPERTRVDIELTP